MKPKYKHEKDHYMYACSFKTTVFIYSIHIMHDLNRDETHICQILNQYNCQVNMNRLWYQSGCVVRMAGNKMHHQLQLNRLR